MDVFLRFMRGKEYPIASSCLNRWLDVFGDRVKVLSDNHSLFQDHHFSPLPKIVPITSLKADIELDITEKWEGNGHSALTAYCLSSTDYFWLIDGDDTLFHHPTEWIKERMKRVEDIVHDYDGLSLDFYRHTPHINQWSLGVACLRKIDLKILESVTVSDVVRLNPRQKCFNIDAIMDTLRRMKKLRLESFCFEDSYFTHCRQLSYHWKDRKLWNVPLDEDIIVL